MARLAYLPLQRGTSRYEEHLAGGSLPGETRAYVAKLANLLAIELPPRWTSGGQSSAAETLFATRSDLVKTRDRLPALMPSAVSRPQFRHPMFRAWFPGQLARSSLDRIREHRNDHVCEFASWWRMGDAFGPRFLVARSSPSHPSGVSALRVTIAIAIARKQLGLRELAAKSRWLFREPATGRPTRQTAR